jgi:hypothetical protein
MKQNVKMFALAIIGLALTRCAGAPVKEAAAGPGPIIGPLWMLMEIRTAGAVIDLNRPALEADGMGDVYSLQFEGETRVHGKAAPNQYSAPCEWGDDSTLGIGLAAATKMLAFKEPEALKEPVFFSYLSRVSRCALTPDDRLELSTADENGGPVVLVFRKAAPAEING